MSVTAAPVPTTAEVADAPGRRVDLELIADLVTRGSRVLDIGCGDGSLMEILQSRRGVDARGIELSQPGVRMA